jgi:hypothetical protein
MDKDSITAYLDEGNYSSAAEEKIASRSEAIYEGAERVLNFSILYTHIPLHIPLYISTYEEELINFDFANCTRGKTCHIFLTLFSHLSFSEDGWSSQPSTPPAFHQSN